MTAAGSSYKGFRFPPEIISHCVWLYHRFPLSFRDVQELMLERGVDGIVKLFGNACGAVDVSGPAGERWWLTASFKPLRQ